MTTFGMSAMGQIRERTDKEQENNVTNTFAERSEAKKHQIEVKKTALAKRNG